MGQWPTDAAAAFLADLDRRIDAATDEQERSKLQRWRDAAGDVAKQVVAEVIVAAGRAGMS